MQKQQWIDQVLQSGKQLQNISPPPHLFEQIEQKISYQTKQIVPYRWTMSIAASFTLLLMLNIVAINLANKPTNNTTEALQQMGFDTDNQLYK